MREGVLGRRSRGWVRLGDAVPQMKRLLVDGDGQVLGSRGSSPWFSDDRMTTISTATAATAATTSHRYNLWQRCSPESRQFEV